MAGQHTICPTKVGLHLAAYSVQSPETNGEEKTAECLQANLPSLLGTFHHGHTDTVLHRTGWVQVFDLRR